MNARDLESKRDDEAFRKWRGERPTGGYGHALLDWDIEDVKMKRCWAAALKWARKRGKRV